MFSYPPPLETSSHFIDDLPEQHTHRTPHLPPPTPHSQTPSTKPQSPPEFHPPHPPPRHAYRPVHPPVHPGAPPAPRTQPFAWFIAAMCAVFWVVVFLIGLIVLIICMVYRPKMPRFDVSTATLNAAHLDMASNLLNADLTVLANITNPNKKLTVDFSYAVINLYFGKTMISTRSVVRFTERRKESVFVSVHMVGSMVEMGVEDGVRMVKEMDMGGVEFRIEGLMRVRSGLGSILSYSYWVHGHCKLLMSRPPGGVALKKQCFTKR